MEHEHNKKQTTSNVKTDYIQLKHADTLAGVFLERVARSTDQPAYLQYDEESQSWQEVSWSEMARRVARWQAAFQTEELKPGDRVALMVRNSLDWVTFDLAAQGLGLVTVPLYTNDRAENIGYILQDAGVRLLLLENNEQWQSLQRIRNQLAGLNRIITLEEVDPLGLQPRLVPIDKWLPAKYAHEPKAIEVPSESLATIVYTSGTTGRSKGVMLSHRNILWDIESGLKIIDVYPNDRFLSFLPLSHTLERTVGFVLAMVAGSSVAFARSIPQLAEDLQTIRPTMLISVPRIFERVYAKIQEKLQQDSPIARAIFQAAVDTGWHRFEHAQGRRSWSPRLALWPLLDKLVASKIREKLGGRLRIAVSGGAPLAPDIAKVFIGLGVPILQGYGLTETSPIITANTHKNNIPASVGVPFPGIEIKISDAEELLVRAPNVMLGYWNNRKATAEVIDPDGWLHTGDKVKLEDDHIFITGRLKEIIVMANGEKVPPADMEMCISMDSLFEQALIIGEGKPYLSALVVLDAEGAKAEGIDPGKVTEEQEQFLLQRINQQLDNFPGYAKVVRLTVAKEPWSIENGLVTPTMKLKRKSILDRYMAELDRLYDGH
ncbi:MAG: long-chain fatty acid--CoA ligase [Candidatus Thiodiazotropha sp.]